MTPEAISALIDQDISSHREELSWFGSQLDVCRQIPKLLEFTDSSNNDEPVMLWLVFEEDPITRLGYKVVYSEEDQVFGLAVHGSRNGILIGLHGSFVETLRAM